MANELIKILAAQAGYDVYEDGIYMPTIQSNGDPSDESKLLEKFALLVKTKDGNEVIDYSQNVGYAFLINKKSPVDRIMDAAHHAADAQSGINSDVLAWESLRFVIENELAEERELCARICDSFAQMMEERGVIDLCAEDIRYRLRGNNRP